MSEWEDRVAINDVLARYADGVNRRDVGVWSSSWDEDGEWFLFGPDTIRGRDTIAQTWVETMKSYPFVIMFVGQGEVIIEGDTARGHSYTNELARLADGTEMRVTGTYEDRYVKRNGRWGFAYRRFTMLHSQAL